MNFPPFIEFFFIFNFDNDDFLLLIIDIFFTSLFSFSITDDIIDLFLSCLNEIFELDSSLISEILFKSIVDTNIIFIHLTFFCYKRAIFFRFI